MYGTRKDVGNRLAVIFKIISQCFIKNKIP